MRFALWLMAIGMLPTHAQADESEEIAKSAQGCWALMAAMPATFKVRFDVGLDGSGQVIDIAVRDFQPADESGRAAVLSATRALQRCSPYNVQGAGIRQIEMTVPKVRTINPFKPIVELEGK